MGPQGGMSILKRIIEPLREEPRLLPILVMIACIMMGSGLVAPVLSLYAQTFGVANTLVGALVTIFGVGRLVANLPSGYLSQRIGRRPLLFGGPILIAVSSAAAAVTGDFNWLLFWRFLQGVGSGVYITASIAALADVSPPKRRSANMALYQSSLQIGATMGPVVGGYAAYLFGYASSFWLYAGVSLLAAATALFGFEDTLNKADARKPLPTAVRSTGLMTAPFTGICIISLTAFFTRTAAVFQLIPLIGHDQFQLGVDMIGLAVTITAFTILLMVPLSAPLTDRFGARAMVLWSTLASGGALWMLYASTSLLGFWLGVIFFGLAAGINYPAIGSFTISALPRERYGPGMGMQRTFGDVGFVFGPVIIGALADLTGGGNLAGVAFNVAILFVASGFFWIVSRGMRRES